MNVNANASTDGCQQRVLRREDSNAGPLWSVLMEGVMRMVIGRHEDHVSALTAVIEMKEVNSQCSPTTNGVWNEPEHVTVCLQLFREMANESKESGGCMRSMFFFFFFMFICLWPFCQVWFVYSLIWMLCVRFETDCTNDECRFEYSSMWVSWPLVTMLYLHHIKWYLSCMASKLAFERIGHSSIISFNYYIKFP